MAVHVLHLHGVGVTEAMEAVCDPDAVQFWRHLNSHSGWTTRLLRYSASRRQVLVIILVMCEHRPHAWWGANGWVATTRCRSGLVGTACGPGPCFP